MIFWIFAALLSFNAALAEELQTQSSSDDVALAKNLEALAERLKDQPDNDKGWYMLGRSYLNMGNYEQSAAAFAHMLAKFKDDHSLSAYYAEAVYMADGQIVTPRVAAAIEATLALNPHDITMLEIKALGAVQSQDLRGAIGLFQRALASICHQDADTRSYLYISLLVRILPRMRRGHEGEMCAQFLYYERRR